MDTIELNETEKHIYQEINQSLNSTIKLRELHSILIYHYNQGTITLNHTILHYCDILGIDLELNY
jgi:hypothetical protein